MPVPRGPAPIRIGLITDEPMRMAGLASVFDQPAREGQPQLVPVIGTLARLLDDSTIPYLVVDLHGSAAELETLNAIRRARPAIRLIVIGPDGSDDLMMDSIVAGARAYLELTAGPEMVRKAIEVVTDGSIWAPRRLLSKLIDRLLRTTDSSAAALNPKLTGRERQVLELIVKANSNREIASHLGIEERTVKAYVGRLMKKTGSDNRVKLSISALSRSLVSPPSPALGAKRGDTRPRVTK